MGSTTLGDVVLFFGIHSTVMWTVLGRSSKLWLANSLNQNTVESSVPSHRELTISHPPPPPFFSCFFLTIYFAFYTRLLSRVNEPYGWNGTEFMDVTKQYYYDSYGMIRLAGNIIPVIHDAFQALSYWTDFMPSYLGYSNVVMETHHYEVT